MLVSHHLDEVLAIADRVTVLRDGRRVATVARDELDHDQLVELIVGRAVAADWRPAAHGDGPTVDGQPLPRGATASPAATSAS